MEWLGKLLASDTFRSGGVLVAIVVGIAAIVGQILKNQPVLVKLEDESRKALDASVQAELTRLGGRLDDCEQRHAECEERQVSLQREFLERDRKREEDITGLRRQLAQYQRTTIRTLENQRAEPKPKAKQATTKGK